MDAWVSGTDLHFKNVSHHDEGVVEVTKDA